MPTPPVVVMGVSGSGKSTVGSALADALGLTFVDGDSLHPPANVAKMAAGIPLDDADRAPWLDAVGAALARGDVVACSALKRRYRDRLRELAPATRVVYLRGSRELLSERLAGRHHAFMPASLLDSQLAALEEPTPDEHAIVLDIAERPDELVAASIRMLGRP